ncbi:hypothetical protein K1719_028673 [Acacia pycnantha]|nr:hypothetical protein K1719_028673 [Acacia pycnantha]
MIERDKLNYIRKHKKELHVDLYSGITDAVARGETDPLSTGRHVILPSSFTGEASFDLDELKPCKKDILSMMFYIKLDKLMHTLKEEKIFGTIKAEVYTIEFQKRGLPHAHIILWLADSDKPKDPSRC